MLTPFDILMLFLVFYSANDLKQPFVPSSWIFICISFKRLLQLPHFKKLFLFIHIYTASSRLSRRQGCRVVDLKVPYTRRYRLNLSACELSMFKLYLNVSFV